MYKDIYKKFFNKYRKLTHSQKLKLIQTILFTYTEEVYVTNNLLHYMGKDLTFRNQSKQGTPLDRKQHPLFGNVFLEGAKSIIDYDLQTNYLDRKYSVKSLNNIMKTK